MALGQIQRLFDEGTLTGLTDAQLLERFLGRREEGAFAALVARHGPMVRAVCRGVLRDQNDAEDAFQATFLVLFRKAGGLRSAGSVGSWLYRVAYRIAMRANAVAARRRERPIEEINMAAEAGSTGEAEIDRELLPIIHAEIDRLPDHYRAPIALCYLEGLSYEQAAHQLGWPLGTVGSRIARARELLRSRLVRRGVTATTASLSVLLAREATAAPAGWVEAAIRAAMRLSEGAGGAKVAGTVSAAVALSDHVLRRMLMIRLIQMVSVLSAAAMAGLSAWLSLGVGGAPKPVAPFKQARAKQPEELKQKKVSDGPIRGRVLTPDGMPVRDAAIFAGESKRGWLIDPVARTDADGRFELDPARLPREKLIGVPTHEWKRVELAAIAPGYGPARSQEASGDPDGVELRLVADDVPIRGRILDTQGRPIPGVGVRLGGAYEPPAGDPDALLRSGTIREDQLKGGVHTSGWWIKQEGGWTQKTIRTGPDGRFRVDGVGRDRLALLEIDGPGIAGARVWAMTRPASASSGPRATRSEPFVTPRIDPLHGATFDYVAVPSRPIEGVVRAKGSGRPVAGLSVSGYTPGGNAHATTDPEGRFRLDGLPKVASYTVQVSPGPGQPYLPATTTVSDTEGLKPIAVSFELTRGVVIRGRLIDKATGKSVAGYQVHYMKLPTNANEGDASSPHPFGPGGFQMIVPPGPALIKAQAEGTDLPYTRARLPEAVRRMGIGELGDDTPVHTLVSGFHVCRMVDIPTDVETFDLDLELTRGASRKGRLIDPDGKPVVGAQVYGLLAGWEVKTLEQAGFEVIGLEPGKPRTVSFVHKDRRLAAVVAVEPGDSPLDVRLVPWGSAIGRAVDPDGQPLRGASVGLVFYDRGGEQIPKGIGFWPSDEDLTADREGRFRIEGLHPDLVARVGFRQGSRPDVFLEPEKAKAEILQHLTARSGETVDLGEIRLSPYPNK
jgi:RNA polymerase sigma factor (sigma-70 family)